ncbi:MAG: diguanylate cyclase domain-containing protein, partial [Sulfurovum sp.]
SFLLFGQIGNGIVKEMFGISLMLGGLFLFSMLHYAFLVRYPERAVMIRKSVVILLDLAVLTMLVMMFEQYGIYFLPFYVWLVMLSGASFGVEYFYTSIIGAALSWLTLMLYSKYWGGHYDILVAFAMTTFLVPLFYLKYIVRMHAKNEELREVLTTTAKDARHDELTGVANRKVYKEEIKKAIKNRDSFALMFIDLNKFKVINDTHGHHIGDEVLKEVVRRLTSCLGEQDFLARLGGDEFVILTWRQKVFLSKFVEKLEREVIGRFDIEGVSVPIELSIGISIFPDDHRSEMMLSKFADEAMYIAKKDPDTYHMFYRDLTEEQKSLSN